jgi:hypothetical protein
MTDREKIMSIVGLLRQGLSSSSIAEQLSVSPPTVWAVKANLTQGKYGDKPISHEKSSESIVGYDYTQKSKAIMAGYKSTADTRANTSDAAVEFSRLLALITSPRKSERDSAKNTIRELAKRGGWAITSEITAFNPVDTIPDPSKDSAVVKPHNRWRRWTEEEEAQLVSFWSAADCLRDATALHQISTVINRSPLALVCRLFKFGMVSVEQGNSLCLDAKTSVLLSETNLVKSKVLNEKNSPRTEVEVEIIEVEDFEIEDVLSTRICLTCTNPISALRLNLVPHALRCAKCQSLLEKNIDYHQYIDEGLAGTREAHKHLRGGLLSDMIKRGKE